MLEIRLTVAARRDGYSVDTADGKYRSITSDAVLRAVSLPNTAVDKSRVIIYSYVRSEVYLSISDHKNTNTQTKKTHAKYALKYTLQMFFVLEIILFFIPFTKSTCCPYCIFLLQIFFLFSLFICDIKLTHKSTATM